MRWRPEPQKGRKSPGFFGRVTAGQFASPGCLYEVSHLSISWVLPSSAAWDAGWEMARG